MTMALVAAPTKRRAAAPVVEHKTLILQKAAIDANGTLTGYGAIFGNVDDGGDVIEPGFFADVVGDFLREGFIAWMHDWGDPCAMPKSAAEDEIGLALAATFHSTPAAQEKRVIAQERLANGQTMGLSIGYEIAPGGATVEKGIRHLRKASRLFEVSLVLVPMNREAGATDVKTLPNGQKAAADNVWTASSVLNWILSLIQDEAEVFDAADPQDEADLGLLGTIRDLVTNYIASTAPDVGTPDDMAQVEAEEVAWNDSYWGWMGATGVPFAQHVERVTAGLKSVTKRTGHLKARRKEGRVLSAANRERLEGLVESLAAGLTDIQDLLASTTTEKAGMSAAEMELAVLETEARLAGHLN